MSEPEIRQARLGDDLTLHYQEQGSGVPVVFIHGLTGDLGSWGAQMPVFAQRFRAIAYSRRFSRPNANDLERSPEHSVHVEADDLARLLEHLDAAPAILVGSSYGAATALALALERPEMVRALVLSEPPVFAWADRVPGGRALREQMERDITLPARAALRAGDDQTIVQLYAQSALGVGGIDKLPPATLERRLANLAPIKALVRSGRESVDLDAGRAAALRVPVLLLSGVNTRPLFTAVFDAARQLLPDVRAHKVEGAGHSVYREQSEAFNAHCLQFIDAVLGTAAIRG